MVDMDWIRDNMKVIGGVVVFAMALPFLLVLVGISFF
jgi:hypothetical protein